MPVAIQTVKQLFARCHGYHPFMKVNTRKVLVANVRALMKLNPEKGSNAKLSAFCTPPTRSVAARTIGYLLNPDSVHAPQLDTLIAVAEAFGVEPWKLLHPEFNAARPKQAPALLSREESAALGKLLATVGVSDIEVEKHLPPAPKSRSPQRAATVKARK